MKPLETYVRTLWVFLQAVRAGMVLNLPSEAETQVPYLRLGASGTWEITADLPHTLALSPAPEIAIPLVLPLVPVILVAHLETQWERNQSNAEERRQFVRIEPHREME